ncbi:hypothetical protein N7474_008678 [Penicillium riverlandense]|uniref:uncharacterized protein n=1 Tax=Penicillium riverlandense TaxID=1903569 RepID=UPI002546D61D|nr:uncharacterized protein N7474_008678 [Penicillium riverlandense]KAJ5812377.1 hypothetical protein N7474_008678 [Penicillium riverlandense]
MELAAFHRSNLLYTQEPLSRYKSGGYHPVTIGDTFKEDRYKTHHKLGWGGFSTVWLAHDKDRNQWVSLKIMTADSHESRELQNLKFLERNSEESLCSHYIVRLLDSFSHEGPNGILQCLVYELLGPSVNKVLADYAERGDKLGSETILRISTQLLKSVAFLVGTLTLISDISGRNIAFACTSLKTTTEQQIFRVLGTPEIESLARLDGQPLQKGLPTQLVKAAEWVDWIDEDEEEIRLLDFGESFLLDTKPEKLAQPGILRVPETIFTDGFDYRVDLWRVGCMIYSILFTKSPFWYLGEVEVLVFQMIGFVEGLPREWQSTWESMQAKSKHDLTVEGKQHVGTLYKPLLTSGDWEVSKLERKFAENVHDPTLAPFLEVIQGLMRFLPADRITADKALDLLERAKQQ